MRYRLALDIGTASCGLVAVELDAQGEPVGIFHRALHIFSEPLRPPKSGGVGEPKKAARRAARMARRVIDRRARRLKRISMLSALLDINRQQIPSDTGQELHALRANAVRGPIELDDILRVLLKLAKRRGYAGEFRIRKDSEQGQVQSGISALDVAMKGAHCTTLGQYLHERFKAGQTLKLKEAGLYAHRKMLVEEFNAIWDQQQRHHPILTESRPDPIDERKRVRPIRDQFFDAIFFQRPLKSVAPMVGNCALELSLPRSPMAQPAMQAFRIEKQLADLRWGMGRNALPLSQAQRDAIREMLNDPALINKDGKLKFEKIYKRFESIPKIPGQRDSLNMERSSRENLTGNRTLRAFKDLGVLESWQGLDRAAQSRVINFLADLGSPDKVDQPEWHSHFTKTERVKNAKTGRWEERQVPRRLDPGVVGFINLLVETKKFDRLSNMGLQTGRASYSIRALERLTDCMRSQGLDEHDAIQKCYPPEPPTGELLPHLPPHKATGNVVVDVALGVVRRAVNDALTALREPPAEVVVELSRDMALGVKARGEIEKKIDKNQKRRERARKELDSHGTQPTNRNILRYLLWEQQDTHCPYCSERLSLEQAVDGNVSNLEHILPRTLTRVGRQRNHLVLAHRNCNDLKRDRTPYEAFGHDASRWAAVTFCATVLESNKQFAKARLLVLQNYEHEVLDDESIAEFSERQYAETSWIGKLTAQWMRDISPRVSVSRGTMTAHLRRIWKLETVIAQARFDASLPVLDRDGNRITLDEFARYKSFWEGHTGSTHPRTDRKIDKRIDHRHHLIDALVIAQTSVSLYQRIARHYKELAERRAKGEPVRLKLEIAPLIQDLREKALEIVREIAIRHKPDRQISGAFFKGLPYRKRSMDNGRIRLTIKARLIKLTDNAGSLDNARKGISFIVSDETRRIVEAEFEKRIKAGQSTKEALASPIHDPRFGTDIRRVEVYQRSGRGFLDGEAAFPIDLAGRAHSPDKPHAKHYVSDGYAFVSIVEQGGKLISADSVPRYEAQLLSLRKSKPKTGEKRIFRGDTLLNDVTGESFVVHQILADAKARVAPLTEARIWDDLRAESGGRVFSVKDLAKMRRI